MSEIMKELSVYPVILEQTVAWGDMDAFGHVNNVQYYRYIESARIAYFDALQVFTEDVLTVVASSQCKYLKPVFCDSSNAFKKLAKVSSLNEPCGSNIIPLVK